MQSRPVAVDIAQDVTSPATGMMISSYESQEMQKLDMARGIQTEVADLKMIGSILTLIPEFTMHATPIGVGGAIGFGGLRFRE